MSTDQTYTTSNGKTFSTPLTLGEAYVFLSLQKNKSGFATDLVAKYPRLSDSQATWLLCIAHESLTKTAAPAKTVQTGDLSGLIAILDKAKEHLKYPKIRLQCGDEKVTVSLNKHGEIQVKDAERHEETSFGWAKVWYGKVDAFGQFVPSKKNQLAGLEELLGELSSDPVGAAKKYGKLTGNCCFCGKALSDERSTKEGYGPICATNFGLPWGGK